MEPFKEVSITELVEDGDNKEKSITHNIDITQFDSFEEADICDSPTE